MKFESNTRQVFLGCAALVLTSSLAVLAAPAAPSKDDKKDKAAAEQVVDAGSFSVFVKGQRVATEAFKIELENGVSVIKSQLKQTGGGDASQKSDLEIGPSGELLRYEWSQSTGGTMTVLPKNDFLIEKISIVGSSKTAEQSFLMPSTSMILDNNFFIHREVLAWRYLAADCKSESAGMKCQQDAAEFGVLVPQDRTSVRVRMELKGKEKVNVRGAERELLRVNLVGESFEWNLWVDPQDHFKVIRVAIPADDTEVVRD